MKEIIRKLRSMKVKKIFVQFPEGLKLKIQDIKDYLEKDGFDVILCLEKCWGACDIKINEAKLLGCDAILHIAHGDFVMKSDIPVIYWDYFHDVDPLPAIEKEFRKLESYNRIGLVSSLQFVPAAEKVKSFLEQNGKKVFVGKTEKYNGQILGCRIGAGKLVEEDVDCFVCVSAAKFYPLGLAIKTDKPVFNLDLEKGRLIGMDEVKKKMMKIAVWNKSVFKDVKKVGLLVSFKIGQFKDPFKLKKTLEASGKEVYVLAMDEFSPEKLEGLKLDVLVNTACPRIIDDQAKYRIPMINLEDILT